MGPCFCFHFTDGGSGESGTVKARPRAPWGTVSTPSCRDMGPRTMRGAHVPPVAEELKAMSDGRVQLQGSNGDEWR